MNLSQFLFLCSFAINCMIHAVDFKPMGEIKEIMSYKLETQEKKLVIGMKIRTDNNKCLKDIPELWSKFIRESIREKIPHQVNNALLAVYTEYESDYTKPYSYIVGCEVSTLDTIPEGLVGITVPQASYAVFTTEGPFPQGLGQTWQTIWKTPLKRAYTSDFEVYGSDFNPPAKPEVKVYIAL